MKRYDASAVGSDTPRSYTQYLARRWASFVVRALGLNRPGFLSTEIVQQIRPICTIPTRCGAMRCLGGHGRLRWRALTFYTEEPNTIQWLDALGEGDVLWDIGANIGLYAIYAAKVSKCHVVAFEPEAQNYAMLLENIVLNGVQSSVEATNFAVTRDTGIGALHVHALTKGGAYNQFQLSEGSSGSDQQASVSASAVVQVQMGGSLDDLVTTFQLPPPTHIKIDVDGNEPDIIAGGLQVLGDPRCLSVLIEAQRDDPEHARMIEQLTSLGYSCVSERSNWESRANRAREQEYPATNMIFTRASGSRESEEEANRPVVVKASQRLSGQENDVKAGQAIKRQMSIHERWEQAQGFLRRQWPDIRRGGWPVLLRKILMVIDVLLAVPVVLAARLLRPVVLIRFGGLPSDAIGHLAMDMELLLCRRDAGLHGRRIVDLFCVGLPVCNQQLAQMWARTVSVSRFARAAERINRWVPGGWQNRFPFDWCSTDIHGLLATTPPHLSFTPNELRQGEEALRRLGVPDGAPFVCFHARDDAYYVGKPRYQHYDQQFRNADLQTYLPAIEALIQRGYVVVRMGAAVERPLPIRHPQAIDYASTARTDFLDIFLCAHCRFYFGDGAGLYNVSLIFRRPVALVNYLPFEFSTSWNPQDLFIPKALWLRDERRLMTFREILVSKAGQFRRDHQYAQMGIEVIDNTPEEITALAVEMDARLNGTWQAAEEDEELQRRFWKTYWASSTFNSDFRTHRRMGAEFLRQHRALLEERAIPQPTMVWKS